MSIQGRMIAMASVEALRRQGVDAESALRIVWRDMLRAERAPKTKDEPKQIAAPVMVPKHVATRQMRAMRDKTILAMAAAGHTRVEIAQAVNLTKQGLHNRIEALSIKTAPGKRHSRAAMTRIEIIGYHATGMTNREICEAMEVSMTTVETHLRYLGIKCNRSLAKRDGGRVSARRAIVARMLSAGKPQAEIARQLGVSPDTICRDAVAIARNPQDYAQKRSDSAKSYVQAITGPRNQDRTDYVVDLHAKKYENSGGTSVSAQRPA